MSGSFDFFSLAAGVLLGYLFILFYFVLFFVVFFCCRNDRFPLENLFHFYINNRKWVEALLYKVYRLLLVLLTAQLTGDVVVTNLCIQSLCPVFIS